MTHAEHSLIDYLLTPQAIRDRAELVYSYCAEGNGQFNIDESKLDHVAAYVETVTKEHYPHLSIPYHSRWRHFAIEGSRALTRYQSATENMTPIERARVGVDLIVPSVLLDAGAGSQWLYRDPDSGQAIGRSEGLALASLRLFMDGEFSSDPKQPLQTEYQPLSQFSEDIIHRYFQVTQTNPLVGVAGRVGLMRALGNTLANNVEMFPNGRPGDLVIYLVNRHGQHIHATEILKAVIQGFGNIWPGRTILNGVNLGDVWEYTPFSNEGNGYIPFHKLSQWLTYSIIETLENNDFVIHGLNELTGLAEYRNGGLFIDSGVLTLKDPALEQQSHRPNSEVIVEWRALTIHLLDILAERIRAHQGMTAEQLPLAKILEGGTWAAGRQLAARKRHDGSPPIQLHSDGTVF